MSLALIVTILWSDDLPSDKNVQKCMWLYKLKRGSV